MGSVESWKHRDIIQGRNNVLWSKTFIFAKIRAFTKKICAPFFSAYAAVFLASVWFVGSGSSTYITRGNKEHIAFKPLQEQESQVCINWLSLVREIRFIGTSCVTWVSFETDWAPCIYISGTVHLTSLRLLPPSHCQAASWKSRHPPVNCSKVR